MRYEANGYDAEGPWNVIVGPDGLDGTLRVILRVENRATLSVTPTGPFLAFDPRDPSHVRHVLLTEEDVAEEDGDIPAPILIPAVPAGSLA